MKKIKILALLAAVFATFAVWQVLMKKTIQVPEETIQYQKVVIAMQEILAGQVLDSSVLQVVDMPESYVLDGTFTAVEDVVGMVSRIALAKGEQLSTHKLMNAKGGEAGLSYEISEGMRAYTIEVGMERGVAGLVSPGDRIDIVSTYLRMPQAQGEAIPGEVVTSQYAVTEFLIQDVEVLAYDNKMRENDAATNADGSVYSSLTVALTPEQVLSVDSGYYIAKFSSGDIRCVLRRSGNQEGTLELAPVIGTLLE